MRKCATVYHTNTQYSYLQNGWRIGPPSHKSQVASWWWPQETLLWLLSHLQPIIRNSTHKITSTLHCSQSLLNTCNTCLSGWERCAIDPGTVYLVPQVLGGAAHISVEVWHMNKFFDSSFFCCPGNTLRDGHKDIVKAIVSLFKNTNTNKC